MATVLSLLHQVLIRNIRDTLITSPLGKYPKDVVMSMWSR